MSALRSFLNWAEDNRWIWSALAVLAFWGLLSVITNRFSIASLSGILLSASFLTVVGIGQMFVVTTGRGNIDLSIASVVTLSAYLALLTVHGQDANLGWGILAAIALGLVVGLFNSALVVGLRVPAIISTLATGYVLATATLLSNRAISGFAVSSSLKQVAAGRIEGVPVMLVVCLTLVVLCELLLRFTVFGRTSRRRRSELRGGEFDWDPRESHRCFDVRHFIGSRIANGTCIGRVCRGRVPGNGSVVLPPIGRGGRRWGHPDFRRFRLRDRRVLRQRFADSHRISCRSCNCPPDPKTWCRGLW